VHQQSDSIKIISKAHIPNHDLLRSIRIAVNEQINQENCSPLETAIVVLYSKESRKLQPWLRRGNCTVCVYNGRHRLIVQYQSN